MGSRLIKTYEEIGEKRGQEIGEKKGKITQILGSLLNIFEHNKESFVEMINIMKKVNLKLKILTKSFQKK